MIVVSDLLISYLESFVDYLVITMPRESTTRSKKRKFRGNRYGNTRETCVVEEEHYPDAGPSASGETAGTLSASARKIGFQNTERCSTSEEGINCNVTGYRLIDMELLSELFQQMPCIECGKSCLILEENPRERHGCASHLRLRCDECGWVYTFYTSKKVKQCFDVNRRLVYAMRSIGEWQVSAKRFCAQMNMPPPPKPKPYSDSNTALSNTAKAVAMESMKGAGKRSTPWQC